MEEKTLVNKEFAALAVAASVVVANYISSKAFGYPFVFCSLWPHFKGIYMIYGPFILWVCVILVGYHALKGRIRESLFPLGFMIAYTQLPNVLELLLYTGGSCGTSG